MARPTVVTIKTRLLGAIRAALALTSTIRRSLFTAISDGISAQLYLLYVYADNLFREAHPSDARGERLDKWGEVVRIPRSTAALARANVVVTGAVGATIPMGSELISAQGFTYIFRRPATIEASGQVTAEIISTQTGADRTLLVGQALSFTTSLAGVQNQVTVPEGGVTVIGSDAESESEYRARITQFFGRTTYQAGGIDDYIAWAVASPLVRYAWVARNFNNVQNQIGVFVLKEDNELLTAIELAEVQAAIDVLTPVTARAIVLNPGIEEVPFTISIRENNLAVQQEVRNNLNELFARNRAPRATVNSDRTVNTGIIYISQIREAVSLAAGEEDNIIATPTMNIAPGENFAILTVGEITFNTLVS